MVIVLSHQRRRRATLGCHRCIARLHPGYNRVDRIGAQARQHKTAIGANLHQRTVAGVGRTAAPGNESGAKQLAPTNPFNLYQHLSQTETLISTKRTAIGKGSERNSKRDVKRLF